MLHRLFQKIYAILIEPEQDDDDLRSREIVLNTLLVGTIAIFTLALSILIGSYTIHHHTYVGGRIIGVAGTLLFVVWLYTLSRTKHYRPAAYLLMVLYTCLAVTVACSWGVTFPISVLLFGLMIVLAGILLGAEYAPYAAAGAIVLNAAIAACEKSGLITPDWSWMRTPTDVSVITGFCILFGVIALVSWLFNYRMENSLHRAHRAEAGLIRQKLLLESKVEERTRELQAAQLERVQQLYRFAELGQLSTALLHDLANHLSSLTLDIEGLKAENRSGMLRRAERSIRYLDDMVLRVRDQLRGKSAVRQFNVASEIEEVISLMNHPAAEIDVHLRFEALSEKKDLRCRGEAIRFRQLIANMLANGIDAYDEVARSKSDKREVLITAETNTENVTITIIDWGKGINEAERPKLFEPFYSTKKTGMGMGLFIVKQITEEHFHGTISLENSGAHTAFIITLAKG